MLQYVDENIGVMSVGFLLPSPDDAVIWRGPKKHSMYYHSHNCEVKVLYLVKFCFFLCCNIVLCRFY